MKECAVIGVTGYAATYLNLLEHVKDRLHLAAAVIRTPSKCPETFEKLKNQGVKIFSSTAEMYAACPHFDLVMIPTSIDTHRPYTCEALAHGASVLVEKPAAAATSEIEEMIRAEKNAAPLFVTVGFQHIYDPVIRKIKKHLLNRMPGRPLKCAVIGLWPRNDSYYARNDWAGHIRTRRDTLVLDSPANNALAHYLNILLFLCGKTFETSARAEILNAGLFRARRSVDNFDSCDLLLKTGEGTELKVLFSHTTDKNVNPQIRIRCEHGFITWPMDGDWKIVSDQGEVIDSGKEVYPGPDLIRTVADKLENRDTFGCPLEIALEHTRCIETLYQKFRIQDVPESEMQILPDGGQIVVKDQFERFSAEFQNFC